MLFPVALFARSDQQFHTSMRRGSKEHSMNRLNHLKKATAVCFVALGFTWLAPSGTVKAVNPPPDGGYPNNNTAEGEQALFSLTTGSKNTALCFRALVKNEDGNFNTAVGSQALANTTTGGGATQGSVFKHSF